MGLEDFFIIRTSKLCYGSITKNYYLLYRISLSYLFTKKKKNSQYSLSDTFWDFMGNHRQKKNFFLIWEGREWKTDPSI